MPREWFCNTEWTPSIERRFYDKLGRARRKSEYLWQQASLLSTTHPDVASRLIDEYFTVSDGLLDCVAHTIRGHAHSALGQVEEAIASHEASIACERLRPGVLSTSTIELPYLIATQAVRKHYPLALRLLKRWRDCIVFLADHFRWHAAQALIAADLRRSKDARVHAGDALEIAGLRHSGMSRHPDVGVVTAEFDPVVRRLERIRDSRVQRAAGSSRSSKRSAGSPVKRDPR